MGFLAQFYTARRLRILQRQLSVVATAIDTLRPVQRRQLAEMVTSAISATEASGRMPEIMDQGQIGYPSFGVRAKLGYSSIAAKNPQVKVRAISNWLLQAYMESTTIEFSDSENLRHTLARLVRLLKNEADKPLVWDSGIGPNPLRHGAGGDPRTMQ